MATLDVDFNVKSNGSGKHLPMHRTPEEIIKFMNKHSRRDDIGATKNFLKQTESKMNTIKRLRQKLLAKN
jgi:hypothetical protein